MNYSKLSGTLVGTHADLPPAFLSDLLGRVPDEDPARALRGFLCLRTDRSTEAETLREWSAWVDLLGRMRLAGVSLDEVERYFATRSGFPAPTVVTARAFVPKAAVSVRAARLFGGESEESLDFSKPLSLPEPEEPEMILAPDEEDGEDGELEVSRLPAGWAADQAFTSLTKGDTCRLAEVPEGRLTDKSRLRVRWDSDGPLQEVTLKTLKDRRRYAVC